MTSCLTTLPSCPRRTLWVRYGWGGRERPRGPRGGFFLLSWLTTSRLPPAHAKAAAHAAHAHTDAEATIAAQSASTKQHTSTARAAGPTQGNAATVSATSQLDKRELAASANAGLPAEALFQLPIIGTVLGAFFLLCGLALLASGLLCKVSEAHEIPARSKLVAGAVCAAAGLTILLCALLIR